MMAGFLHPKAKGLKPLAHRCGSVMLPPGCTEQADEWGSQGQGGWWFGCFDWVLQPNVQNQHAACGHSIAAQVQRDAVGSKGDICGSERARRVKRHINNLWCAAEVENEPIEWRNAVGSVSVWVIKDLVARDVDVKRGVPHNAAHWKGRIERADGCRGGT